MQRSWSSLLSATAAALAVVLMAEVIAHRLAPPVHLLEVDEAMRTYERSDPLVLVLGSSHARSFPYLNAALGRPPDDPAVVAVPVEWGKLSAYEWVLRERVLPELDARETSRLRHAILVTEWWDSKAPDGGLPSVNLPARAWTWRHFLGDVVDDGLNGFNRNFLQRQWSALWRHSALIQDRGHGRIGRALRERLSQPDPAAAERERSRQLAGWRRMVEQGRVEMFDDAQTAALHRILETLARRDIETTILLYPRMPGTLSERGKRETLDEFALRMRDIAEQYGCRFVDLSHRHPLEDEHFAADFDHVTPRGNRLLARTLLDGPLRFLDDSSGRGIAR